MNANQTIKSFPGDFAASYSDADSMQLFLYVDYAAVVLCKSFLKPFKKCELSRRVQCL